MSICASPPTPLNFNLPLSSKGTPVRASKFWEAAVAFLSLLIDHACPYFTSGRYPVQAQIRNPGILVLIPFYLFMTSQGNSCPRIRPNQPSWTHFCGAFSWQSKVVASVVAQTWAVLTNPRRTCNELTIQTRSTNRTNEDFCSLTLVLGVLSDFCKRHLRRCRSLPEKHVSNKDHVSQNRARHAHCRE